VQPVFDVPVVADMGRDVGGVGQVGGQAGDPECGVGAVFAAGVVGGVALDQKRVFRVGEIDRWVIQVGAERGELDGAAFAAAVPGSGGGWASRARR
jgi:hypothetical protein